MTDASCEVSVMDKFSAFIQAGIDIMSEKDISLPDGLKLIEFGIRRAVFYEAVAVKNIAIRREVDRYSQLQVMVAAYVVLLRRHADEELTQQVITDEFAELMMQFCQELADSQIMRALSGSVASRL